MPVSDQPAACRVTDRLTADPATRQENWCLSPAAARLLYILVRTGRMSRILEIGTSIGYSALHLARALKDNQADGNTTKVQLDTIDVSPERQAVALTNLTEAGLEGLVAFHCGDALSILKMMTEQKQQVDLMFLDARKSEYIYYFELADRLIRSGGLLVADNTQSHRDAMQNFLDAVNNHPDWESTDLDTPAGLLVARKR